MAARSVHWSQSSKCEGFVLATDPAEREGGRGGAICLPCQIAALFPLSSPSSFFHPIPPRIHIVTFGKKWPYTNNTQGSIKKVTIQVSLKGLYSDIEPPVLSLYGCFLVSQCDHILTIHWQYMAIKKKVTIQIRIRAPYIDNCSAVLSPYGCFFVIHPDNIPTIHRQYIACSQKEQWTLVQGCPLPYTPSFISL